MLDTHELIFDVPSKLEAVESWPACGVRYVFRGAEGRRFDIT